MIMNQTHAAKRSPSPSPIGRRTLCSLVAAAVLVASTLAQGHTATRSFLWKASGTRGALYLVGSIHALPPDAYPLNPAIEAAFKDADLLVEEVDFGEMMAPAAQLQMLTRGMLPSEQSLDKVLSPATLALVNKSLADLGPAGEMLKRFKPWMLALTVQFMELQKAGFDPNLGLDKHFYDLAQSTRKEVQGLETVEYQLLRFDEMLPVHQDRFLADTLKEIATEQANIGKLTDAWKAGDAATIERIVLADVKSDPVIYRRLLVERNQNWMPKLEALFARSGQAFVVVGAAHLVGPDGLLAMLKAKGYSVEQM